MSSDPQQVARVNSESQAECRRALANIPAWCKKHPHDRQPSFWMLTALRAPDRVTPETHRIICQTLQALDLGGPECGYIGWMHTNGANGANVHGYLTPLVLALIADVKVRDAGERALRAELAHMNATGDVGEFNLLESHSTRPTSWSKTPKAAPAGPGSASSSTSAASADCKTAIRCCFATRLGPARITPPS